MAITVDGKKIASSILQDLATRVKSIKKQGITPALAVVRVGNNKPSITYVRKKEESAHKIGVDFFKFEIADCEGKDELIARIKQIQAEHNLSGMILQLPVPEKLWPFTREIVNNINIEIDVDCLSHLALGRVMMNESPFVPPTPGAIMEILKYYQVMLEKTEKYLLSNRNISVKDYKGAKFRIRSYKKSIQEIKDRISLINRCK